MTWEFEELVRVHADVLALSSCEELWDRVVEVAWQRREMERATWTEKQRAFRSRQHGRLYHCQYERERRKRNKTVDGAVRCCAVCRQMYTLTRQQQEDGTRFCSMRCAARFRVAKRPIRPPRMVTIGNKTRSLREWAKHYGITVEMVYRRMREGMSEVEALTKPKAKGRR
jgi:hypothetical protein